MNLDEYLVGLKNCVDDEVKIKSGRIVSRFTAEFGVYDNWPILLRAEVEDVVKALQEHEKFSFKDTIYFEGKRHLFSYIPGTVELQVLNSAGGFFCNGNEEEIARQQSEYDITLLLHPYLENKIENVSDTKAMTMAINDLANYIKENNIPACFPLSTGWNDIDDYSRIVRFDP